VQFASDLPAVVDFGVIACGFIARAVHLPTLSRLTGTRVAALAEPDPDRLQQASRLAPCAAAVADYRELLNRRDVQGVIVGAPPALQAQIGIATLTAGKHLYLEKPIAIDLASADQLLAAWRGSGLHAMAGFNYRFHPLHVAARNHIQQGRIGNVVAVRSIFSAGSALPQWKRTRHTGGGALLDLGSHHFDLLPYLLGAPVREVRATIRSLASDEDLAAVTMTLDGGVLVQSLFQIGARAEDRIEVYGQEGTMVVDRFRSLHPEIADWPAPFSRLRRLGRAMAVAATSPLLRDDLLAPTRDPSYASAMRYFADCVRTGRAPSPNLLDGRRSLAVVIAAETSARTGRVVPVAEFEP